MKPLALPLLLALIAFASGCATHNSLKPGAERVYTEHINYVIGTPEQVDRRCQSKTGKWDSGETMAGSGKRAACCTVFRGFSKKIWVWMSRENSICLIHEQCHIDEFLSGRNGHGRCHDFGGRESNSKRRL